jgi:hypothetical protein
MVIHGHAVHGETRCKTDIAQCRLSLAFTTTNPPSQPRPRTDQPMAGQQPGGTRRRPVAQNWLLCTKRPDTPAIDQ